MARTCGLPGTYTSGGCRCDECTAAYVTWDRLRRHVTGKHQPMATYRAERATRAPVRRERRVVAFEPLAEAAGPLVVAVLAELLSVAPVTIHRWKRQGVPADRADDLAVRLGYHPCEVWPDWFETVSP